VPIADAPPEIAQEPEIEPKTELPPTPPEPPKQEPAVKKYPTPVEQRVPPTTTRPRQKTPPATSRPQTATVQQPAATASTGGYQNRSSVTYLSRGKASYPAECRRQKQSGTVLLELFINEEGRVDRVEVARSSGFPALDAAAVAAERKSKFQPILQNGVPLKCRARVPYTFRLE
jgi:protein TonB